ncbi:aminopeptidase N-like [Coregonus clupeaformis]|uniref:aminopeptidase N-like n=1 Tax=Coregonus clupeaformis TaxID=59861 RepID=UPI001E1C9764|nr:aminopeptidase N-like [Coregonus clupeaformis]
MGGGFYVSKVVGVVDIVFGAGAVATIIALAVVYSQEVAKNNEVVSPTNGGSTVKPPVNTPVIPTTAPSNEPWDKYRLPDTLKPDHYNLTLWPRLTVNAQGLYIFTGKSYVVFQRVKETDLILIHSNKLNYTKWDDDHLAKLTALCSTPAPAIKASWLKVTTQFLVLQLHGKLTVGEYYKLDTVFVGELADDMGGFYRSVYMEDGEQKVVATTQMQPTDARKAFPCFDEPAMKAIFHITLLHPPDTVALSNGMEHASAPVTEVGPEVAGNVWRTSFDETKKMSTYLLAFIVSDYAYINSSADNVLVIVLTYSFQNNPLTLVVLYLPTLRYNQVNAIRMASSTGVMECQNLTKGWYSQWMADPVNNPIHPNLRTTVYCSAISAGEAAEWEFGWEQFEAASIAIEADKLRSALACTKQPWLLNKYLDYTLDATKIRKQDVTSTIVYIASNVVGQSLAWDFMRDRWGCIFTQYGGGSFSFSNLIDGVTKRFSTEFELKQFMQFQADNSELGFGSGTLAVSQDIERTTANIKWVAENRNSVQAWFKAHADIP